MGVRTKEGVHDLALDPDPLAVDDPQMKQASTETFLDVGQEYFPGFMGWELMEIERSVNGIFDGIVRLCHTIWRMVNKHHGPSRPGRPLLPPGPRRAILNALTQEIMI